MANPTRASEADRRDRATPAEVAAYEHMLFTPGWTMVSLAAALEVSSCEAAAVVSDLMAHGLLRQSQEDPDRLVPVLPLAGLAGIVGEAEADLVARTEDVRRLRALTASIIERYDRQRDQHRGATFEVLERRDAAVGRIGELMRSARTEVLTAVTTLPSEQALTHARTGDHDLMSRGVALRGIYLEGHRRRSPELRRHLSWLVDGGASIRIIGSLPARFIVVDRRVAAFALDPGDSSAGAVVTTSAGAVELCVTLFGLLWDSAREDPAGAAAPKDATDPALAPVPVAPPIPVLDEVELALLRLLAKGNKDESVARRMGMSVRSVRRTISSLCERFDADSRFQLGVKATAAGLLR